MNKFFHPKTFCLVIKTVNREELNRDFEDIRNRNALCVVRMIIPLLNQAGKKYQTSYGSVNFKKWIFKILCVPKFD